MDAGSQMSIAVFLFAMATALLAVATARRPGPTAVPIRARPKKPAREG